MLMASNKTQVNAVYDLSIGIKRHYGMGWADGS